MAEASESEGVPRFAIHERDLNRLLRAHAPKDPARTQLKQLILGLQDALHGGLPLRVRATSAERRERRDHLNDLASALGRVARVLWRRATPARRVVDDVLGHEIARLLTDEAFEEAGVPVHTPSERDLAFIRSRSREPEAAVAAEARSRRAMRGNQPGRVLANVVAHFHALVAARLEIERGGKGGRPSHPERAYVLSRLALAFEDIFDTAPTSSETGQYVKLSEAVLGLFGLETTGLVPAAKRVLAKIRRRGEFSSKPRK